MAKEFKKVSLDRFDEDVVISELDCYDNSPESYWL